MLGLNYRKLYLDLPVLEWLPSFCFGELTVDWLLSASWSYILKFDPISSKILLIINLDEYMNVITLEPINQVLH